MNPLIGIYSPARQHGKTTVANEFVKYGYSTAKFAQPIYSMFIGLCMSQGMSMTMASAACNERKEEASPLLGGLSFRTFAEGVGTKWGRDMFSKTLWVDMARERFGNMIREGCKVIVDDVRFENEYETLASMGALMVKVVRPAGNHPSLPSDGHLDFLPDSAWQAIFINDTTRDSLASRANGFVRRIAVTR